MVSTVRSRAFCDSNTIQAGLVGSASNSITSSPGTQSTTLVNDDVRADGLFGILGKRSDDPGSISLTRNYLSIDADFFINNSLGIGLQQEYAVTYQRYLRPCESTLKGQRFFASVGAGVGYMNQRLYATTGKVNSAVIPLSAQFSYILTNIGQAPKMLFSAQISFVPLLNDTHAYQANANVTVQIPTRFKFLNFSISEMDFYMNNAPRGFKRNYQSGSVQLTFSWGGTVINNPPDSRIPGACYTADTLSHLYCYDQVASSECSPPSIFRPRAKCSAPGIGPLNQPPHSENIAPPMIDQLGMNLRASLEHYLS